MQKWDRYSHSNFGKKKDSKLSLESEMPLRHPGRDGKLISIQEIWITHSGTTLHVLSTAGGPDGISYHYQKKKK